MTCKRRVLVIDPAPTVVDLDAEGRVLAVAPLTPPEPPGVEYLAGFRLAVDSEGYYLAR